MKKKCKKIDIKDWETVRPWVKDCILRHKKRYDFKKLLLAHGLTRKQYEYAIDMHDYNALDPAIDAIAKDACGHISRRALELPPVRMEYKIDSTSEKRRLIGKEDAMQQVYDFIAVFSCSDIFHSRMVDQQMSSIKGRGQIKGMQMIRSWIREDNKAIEWSRKHNVRYTSTCRYHTKLDIEQCYGNTDMEIFMNMLEHDCANEDIIWLWRTLLKSHHVDGYTGVMIGALPSQWAVQLMLSFIYRRAMELKYQRRGKTHKMVNHMCMFMDDMALFGSNRRRLRQAIELLREYALTLGFKIKENYEVHELKTVPVDMMGFVIYRNGKVEMRERNFIHSRRMINRYHAAGRLVPSQAKRINSYKGFFKYSDSRKISQELKTDKVFGYCSKMISFNDKEAQNGKNVFYE